jgi:hypothetical protein
MGIDVPWSPYLAERHAGRPLKGIALSFADLRVKGEAVISATGLEGGAVYALSGPLRDAVMRDGYATLFVDLRPEESAETLAARLARVPRRHSAANRLRRALALDAASIALLHEADRGTGQRPDRDLAALCKALPLQVTGFRPLDRAISTAGGVPFSEVDGGLMLKRLPGVFVAGEMLDWEAPTGGYLLQACFATGVAAAEGIGAWLAERKTR